MVASILTCSTISEKRKVSRFSKHLISKQNFSFFFSFWRHDKNTGLSRMKELDIPRDNVDCRFEAARSEGQGSSSAVHQAVNL